MFKPFVSPEAAHKVSKIVDTAIEIADLQTAEVVAYLLFLISLIQTSFWVDERNVGILYMVGAAFQFLALVFLFVKVWRTGSGLGISVNSLSLLCISHVLRVAAMAGSAYIPLDKERLGTIYVGIQCVTVLVVAIFIAVIHKFGRDDMEAISGKLCVGVVVFCAGLSYFTRADLDEQSVTLNMLWMTAKHIEAVDMIPFLAMGVKYCQIENLSVHFLLCMFISRCFVGFIFFEIYEEFTYENSMLPGYVLFIGHLVELIILADFMVQYLRIIFRNGTKELMEQGMYLA